ncbi:sigma-70 family RNA polymerase sigma factor [Salinarimonas rosea]|uniref:sigma-70 family RNA polymerase sigma factor n=1 Tax=Salinarimonas rosea TaxID=552063 RepID=UPI0004043FAC|nr:sigma-70 family RNA polymerase sigma factor [Salinarimonas rosea]
MSNLVDQRSSSCGHETAGHAVPPARSADEALRSDLLAATPHLRAYALSLCGSPDRADDLTQDTLLRALSKLDRFEPGTNLRAWLFTILRNLFFSEHRKRRHEVEDVDGVYSERLTTLPAQQARLDFEDFRAALARLCPEQREALILVGAEGLTYEEAAGICGVAVGTIKSRVHRARLRLAEYLGLVPIEDFGPDRTLRAALLMAA